MKKVKVFNLLSFCTFIIHPLSSKILYLSKWMNLTLVIYTHINISKWMKVFRELAITFWNVFMKKLASFVNKGCTYFWKLKSPLANKIMHGWQETLDDDFLTSSKKSLQITKLIQKLASKWLFKIPGGVEGISRSWSQSHLKFIIVIKSSIGLLWVP